ncbi:terpene synthase family protein [Streptacidiphilus monticola]|jgi:hypothetical protein|uniref:Terpene synthase n=1 Tax=Streptacidiphilus monticola TaxID=2161674 RepID=A0ABW1GAK0_9ACTN
MQLRVPWQTQPSPYRDEAAEHNLEWLRSHGMLKDPAAVSVYERWDIPTLAARSFPDLDRSGLRLATDMFSFYFLFDDQFDGEVGLDPLHVARVTDELTAIAHGGRPVDTPSPVASAFGDLWRRLSLGMSRRWRSRAAFHWEEYFSAHPSEALGRVDAVVPSRAAFLEMRRCADGAQTVLDAVERFGGEVPPAALHNPTMRLLRQYAADAPAFSNDVWSYDKEAPRGDVYNLVVITQHELGCGLAEAKATVQEEAQEMVDSFARMRADVPRLCDRLGVHGSERLAVSRYVAALASWLAGWSYWEQTTLRYRAEGAIPVDQPNYIDELLHAS